MTLRFEPKEAPIEKATFLTRDDLKDFATEFVRH